MKNYEVWITFRSNGRPSQMIGQYDNYEDALAVAEEYEENNPCNQCGIGETFVDSSGFVQWDHSE